MLIVVVFFHGPWLRYWYLYLGATNFLMPMHLKSLDLLSPLWSLAVEEQFYLVWPLVVYFLNPKWILRCAAGLVLLAPMLRYFCTPMFSSPWAVYMLLPFRMDTLAVGALAALTWPIFKLRLQQSSRFRQSVRWGTLGIFLGCGLLLLLAQREGYTTFANSPVGNLGIYECTLGMMSSMFLLALMGTGKELLSSWPFLWLGRISYSFYLIHLLFLRIIPGFAGTLSLACSIGYAVASWFLIERPLLTPGRPEPALVTKATSFSPNS